MRLREHIASLAHGDHACLLHDDAAAQVACAADFIAQGVARRECSAYLCGDRGGDAVAAALRTRGIPVAEHLRSGRLALVDASSLRDSGGLGALLREQVERALLRGFGGLRVAAEMSWGLRDAAARARLGALESQMDAILPTLPAVAICQYDRSRFDAAALIGAVCNHRLVGCGARLCDNAFYHAPDVRPRDRDAQARLEWMLARLDELRSQRAQMEGRLAEDQARTLLGVHGMMTPLRALRDQLHLLARSIAEAGDPAARATLERALQAAAELDQQLDDITPQTNRISHRERTRLVAAERLVHLALERLAPRLGAARACCDVGCLPRVRCLPRAMLRCFELLIANALDRARGPGLKIGVTGRAGSDEHVIAISDDGRAIDMETTRRVLLRSPAEPEAPQGRDAAILDACRRIVLRHEGRFWVEGGARIGATVSIALPA